MKIFLLFLVVVSSGCSTFRKAQKNDRLIFSDRSEINISHQADTSRLRAYAGRKVAKRDSTAGKMMISLEYDTDKPIDPQTGKPPVKSEQITVEGILISEFAAMDGKVMAIDKNLFTDEDHSQLNQKVETRQFATEIEKKKPPWPIWIISVIVVIAAGYGLKQKFL